MICYLLALRDFGFGYVIQPGATPPSYSLAAGWNLVGFKPQPDPTAPKLIGVYLASITGSYDVNNVWIYNNDIGTWTRADAGTTIHPGDAVWILMTSASVLRP